MTVQILVGDCRDQLRTLADKSVNSVVTSPPYWGLRDYGVPPSVWGGDPACKHEFAEKKTTLELRKGSGLAVLGQRMRGGGLKAAGMACEKVTIEQGFCIHCNAWRGCLGLEPTYQLYLEHLVEIFDEVWRVLRDDGTLWINMGDCYATRPSGWSAQKYWDEDADNRTFRDKPFATISTRKGKSDNKGNGGDAVPNQRVLAQGALKEKDLAGMPWRLAFALQDAGWWLRRDTIWHKLNPMPESVYDRPTTAHEYLFLFSKSGSTKCWRHRDGQWTWNKPAPDYIWRHRDTRMETRIPHIHSKKWFRVNLWRGFDYYYDFAAIMEPSSPNSHARAARSRSSTHKNADGGPLASTRGPQSIAIGAPVAGRYLPQPAGWDEGEGHHGSVHREGRRQLPPEWKQGGPNSRFHRDRTPKSKKLADHDAEGPRTKNNNNWDEWSKARDRAGGQKLADYGDGHGTVPKQNDAFYASIGAGELVPMRNKRSVWSIATKPFKEAHFATFPPKLVEPCILAGCPKDGVVLDPFGGAGTVGVVAQLHGRNAILIEINPKYAAMAEARIARERMGPEEKKRHATKTSGKIKPVRGLPLFKTRTVTRDRKGARA